MIIGVRGFHERRIFSWARWEEGPLRIPVSVASLPDPTRPNLTRPDPTRPDRPFRPPRSPTRNCRFWADGLGQCSAENCRFGCFPALRIVDLGASRHSRALLGACGSSQALSCALGRSWTLRRCGTENCRSGCVPALRVVDVGAPKRSWGLLGARWRSQTLLGTLWAFLRATLVLLGALGHSCALLRFLGALRCSLGPLRGRIGRMAVGTHPSLLSANAGCIVML